MPVTARAKRNHLNQMPVEIKPAENLDDLEINGCQTTLGLPSVDFSNILLLTFLYVLQGIPLGLTAGIPYFLTSKHASYAEQAFFSFTIWPFSLKLIWAPIIDSVYPKYFGRRKFWLIPIQYGIGVLMYTLSPYIQFWSGGSDGSINIQPLTLSFFAINFLAATQDIVVDGWALTILSRKNVGWASTCNTVGQTLGYFIAFILFISLESAQFCNDWLRQSPLPHGIITFEGFLKFWSIVFAATTTLLAMFKTEKPSMCQIEDCILRTDNEPPGDISNTLSLSSTYSMLLQILKMRRIQLYIVFLFVTKIAFSATDSLTALKLMEHGVSKEKMVLLGVLIIPVQIILPVTISKVVAGPTPLRFGVKVFIPRILYGIVFVLFTYCTPMFGMKSETDAIAYYPYYYYILLLALYASHQVVVYILFISYMSFHANISDPYIGGTYMTLLNTVANLAGTLPNTLVMYLVDPLSYGRCSYGNNITDEYCSSSNDCIRTFPEAMAKTCERSVDGYYVLVIGCTVFGLLSCRWVHRMAEYLQALTTADWRIRRSCT